MNAPHYTSPASVLARPLVAELRALDARRAAGALRWSDVIRADVLRSALADLGVRP